MSGYTSGRYPNLKTAGVQEFSAALTAATTTTAGGVLAIANPLGVDVIITSAYLNITTAATTATNTMDVGVAASGTTSSDTLFDGQAASAGLKTPGGTNGGVPRLWKASEYVTATAAASLAGMVGTINLVYIRA